MPLPLQTLILSAALPFGTAPQVNSKGKEVPHGVRLYSIASSRYGDSRDGKTCTLCVVRVIYRDAAGNEVRR